MKLLQGVYVALTTPFNHEGDLYPAKIAFNIARLNLLNLGGYVVCGSTGESKMLTHGEKERLWAGVAEAKAEGRALVAGVGMESARETVELANLAAGLGYQAAMVLTPHYFRSVVLKPENQLLYYRTVADQSKIPVIIYNFPQNTMYDMPVEVVAKLSEHPNIVGIKESSGNIAKVLELLRDVKPGFSVSVGAANTFLASLDLGVAGGIFAFANCAPYSLITIWEAFRQRDHEAAMDWQKRISRAVSTVLNKHGIPGIKYAAELNGYYGGPCRNPLAPLSEAAKQEIAGVMSELTS